MLAPSVVAVALLVLARAAPATAQPVSYQLAGDVAAGKKPALRLVAAQAVRDVRLELERDDGRRFTAARASLAAGEAVTFPVGDGAPGRARYRGTLSARPAAGPDRWTGELAFETLVRAPVKLGYDLEHLDLDGRQLRFTMSRPAGRAELVAVGEDGAELGRGEATFRGEAPGTWVAVGWTQPDGARVLKLRLRAVTAEGLEASVELVPWSVTIDHEDVTFDTDRAEIAPGEAAKLDASLARIEELARRTGPVLPLRLYVAGHTDTVGPGAKNRALSLARARAIAAYFRAHGLAVPIAYAGFGEDVPRVATPDETDARANRRADYVLGPAAGAPPFGGRYAAAKAVWRALP